MIVVDGPPVSHGHSVLSAADDGVQEGWWTAGICLLAALSDGAEDHGRPGGELLAGTG